MAIFVKSKIIPILKLILLACVKKILKSFIPPNLFEIVKLLIGGSM